jgi:hypothetical protein
LLFGLVLLLLLFGLVESLGEVVVEVEDGFVALLSVGLPMLVEELPVVPEVVELPGLIADEELPVALSVPSEPLWPLVVPVAPVVPLVLVEPVTPPEVPVVPLVPMLPEVPVLPTPEPVVPAPVALPPDAPPAAPPPAAPPPDWANTPPAARETEARIVAATLPIRMSSIPPEPEGAHAITQCLASHTRSTTDQSRARSYCLGHSI